jgi:Domain of unknown function (DUF4258)
MPPLEYDPHARARMAERGVDEEEVELALKRQIRKRPGAPGSIWIDGYGRGDRIIPVCVLISKQTYVKTVGWPKKRP